MRKGWIIGLLFGISLVVVAIPPEYKDNEIYHDGWIDLNKSGKMDPYENPELDIEKRIDDLLSRMTMEEKTCQMTTLYGYGRVAKDELPKESWKNEIWKDGIANIDEHLNGLDRQETQTEYSWPPSKHAKALNEVQRFFIEETRLGIPVDFTNEGIRGLCYEKATSFPAQIGVGSTWDLELVSAIGHVTGKEARAVGYTNIYSPIMDLARDPRWGRTVESYSEDPFLTAQYGVAQVRALQSEGVISTPKHFAVYSIPSGGRDGKARTDPKATWRDVETVYLAPFRAAIRDAGALGVMSSYNDYDGIPIASSPEFLIDILRKKWGFKGYVVSDSWSVEHLFEKHKVAPTYKDAVRQVVLAGINVRTAFNMPHNYIEPLRELVSEGDISMETIDERVRPVLRVKFHLGLFDNPYVENPEESDKIVRSENHMELALRAARESIVLLKNEGTLLPLRKDIKSILVTGPNATETKELMSRYGPQKVDVITVLEGIKEKVAPTCEIKYVKGCDIIDDRFPESEILYEEPPAYVKNGIEEAVKLAKSVDVVIVVLGETREISKESRSRISLNLPGYQEDLMKSIFETRIPTVVVLLNGRPLTINWVDKHVPSIIEAWFPGELGGRVIADVLFGDYNPGGKLPITFPKYVGQIPMNFPHKRASQAEGEARVSDVLYPFGHGLSYTKFEYSDLRISPTKQKPNNNITVSFTIKNIGERKGDEVVQLYISDLFSSVVTFEKVLRGFKRITLKPGESKKLTFTLKPDDLALLDRNMKWTVEPGEFKVMVGSSSDDIRLEGNFEIVE